MNDSIADIWAAWLLDRRFGGDVQRQKEAMNYLNSIRDKVIDNADLTEEDTVLDVGAGDGLVAFGVLEAASSERTRVIFNEISADLLERCRTLAEQMGVLERCSFLQASAEDLSELPANSVDVVVFRSVLIYVPDKAQAFREFFRVLKPGGRISCFEPINRYGHSDTPGRFWGYDVTAIREIADRVRALYQRLQPFDTDPMLNFDERDLIDHAARAGFSPVHLRLEAEFNRDGRSGWEAFWRTAGNPRIPTLEEAVEQTLTKEEADLFVRHMRATVEGGTAEGRGAKAYLWATKPRS